MIENKHKVLIIVLFLFIAFSVVRADRSKDVMILDGSEPLVSYGMDTTGHWWAVTQPFVNNVRLVIDGWESNVYREIKSLTFSPDGNKWAFFANDNTQWNLVTKEGEIKLNGSQPGEILFSPNSETLVYSYLDGDHETIVRGDRKTEIVRRTGKLYTSFGGERIAIMGYRGDRLVININGNESAPFDEIKPIGFWVDGSFLFAGRNGNFWEIYKNTKAITESYSNITETVINLDGTAAGALVTLQSGRCSALLISEELTEPQMGRQYDEAAGLVMHPTQPLIAYSAKSGTKYYVVLSGTEYDAGDSPAKPLFTCDGKELYFSGCKLNCFININGRAYQIKTNLVTGDNPYAMKPGSRTIAYNTSTSLVIRYLEKEEMVAGMMVDETITPRYNWRTGRYETLGRINQKLYLLTCTI